jgi:S1-C subfamily serine protease
MKNRQSIGVSIVLLAALAWVTAPAQPKINPQRPSVHPVKAGMYGGTGVAVARSGNRTLVITANHVVQGGGEFKVNGVKAYLLGKDEDWDLAALLVEQPLPTSRLSRKRPQIGDTLTVCGYGTGEYKESTGRVVGYATANDVDMDWVHLNAPGRSGDSGGPIFYPDGRVGAILWGTDRIGAYGTECMRVRAFIKTLPSGYADLIHAALNDYTIYGK